MGEFAIDGLPWAGWLIKKADRAEKAADAEMDFIRINLG